MAEQVTVKTKFGQYNVLVGNSLDYGKLAREVKKPCQVIIVSDDNVFPLYGENTEKSFRENGFQTNRFIIKSGESSKNISTITNLLEFLASVGVTRADMLVALGGGVIGDMTGFAAAIYLRGIPYMQLPTTILAAVDSSVGGKTGVDLPAGKNLVGAFHQPIGVFCDTNAFASLPKEVYSDGMAEVIKHGMIADKELLLSLLDQKEHSARLTIADICRRNVAIKANVVEQDEFDVGVRMLLNFGHTVGHAVEVLSGYQISHGKAVAMGMMIETKASEKSGLTEKPCSDHLKAVLKHYDLPVGCDYSAKELAKAALQDKKRFGETISLIIPREMGRAELIQHPVAQLEDFIAKGLGE